MNAYTIIYPTDSNKAIVTEIKVHAKTDNVYIIKFVTLELEKKYYSLRKNLLWYNRDMAQMDADIENNLPSSQKKYRRKNEK